jgi:ubiquinone/menaquinone biosynthesis C-methylase UbiE
LEASWDDLSNWYDAKQGETGDLWHRALIDPPVLQLVGDVRGKDVLDLGCGNGYLSRRMAREGARVTAVDSSERMIQKAKKHDPENKLEISYICSSANRLSSIPNESFEIIFANMSLMDIEDAAGAISEVGRVLKKGGKFVSSISHPCFDNGPSSGWLIERSLLDSKVYRRIRAYIETFSDEIPWKVSPAGERRFTTAYHRPLSWYARMLAQSGLAIIALEEPEPTPEFREMDPANAPGLAEVPLHLVIGAVKL